MERLGRCGRLAALAALATVAAASGCGPWVDDTFCSGAGCGFSDLEWQRLTTLADPPAVPPDPTNQWADDPRAAALGQRFYYDVSFSGVARNVDALKRPTNVARAPAGQPIRVSCASCHDLGRGGVDVTSTPGNVSIGAGVTDVNALPTVNVALRGKLFWNGRMTSLWGLNLVVGESDLTMNGTRLQTAHVLANSYGDDLQAVFGSVLEPDWRQRVAGLPSDGKPGAAAYDSLSDSDRALATTLFVVWGKALAAFERRLVSRGSAFDRWMFAGPGSTLIPPAAQRGAQLFVGKASCIDCHSGPLLTDEGFHDVAVPQAGPSVPTVADCTAGSACDCAAGKNCLPWGAYNGQVWIRDTGPRWQPIIDAWNDDPATRGLPAAAPVLDPALQGAWRTPSLRDVALTGPYMHDGLYETLEDVVRHYNTGALGEAAIAVGTPAPDIKPLGLTDGEAADLVAFLKTLTGAPLSPDLLVAVPPLPSPDAGTGGMLVPPAVQAIFASACTSCHVTAPDLLDAQAAYADLVNVAATCPGKTRVVPGNASQSYLVAKLRGSAGICGIPMPYGGPRLPEAQIQAVESWINGLRP
jgi:cytochrome c peroxidase